MQSPALALAQRCGLRGVLKGAYSSYSQKTPHLNALCLIFSGSSWIGALFKEVVFHLSLNSQPQLRQHSRS